MQEPGEGGGGDRQQAQRLGHALPDLHHRADAWVLGQIGVQLGLVHMLQHVHHVGATHALRVVQAGVLVAARFQVFHTAGRVLGHRLLAAEGDRAGRAGLHAGRLLAHRHPVRTQRAFVGLVVLPGNARHVERTTGHAVAAADAVLFLEVDDAIGVLDDRAGRRTGLQAARIAAVHAAFLADQPLQLALLVLVLAELHHRPRLIAQVRWIVIAAHAAADLVAQVVPFHAGDLAGLAADAFAHVDQLGDLAGMRTARFRRGRGGGRAADDVQRLQ